MYSLSATSGLGRMCTVTDGGCQIPYLFGDVSGSSEAVFYATICYSMEPYVKKVGLLWQCRIFSRYWDELLAECHHSFFFGWNLCNLLLLMNLLCGLNFFWVAALDGDWHAVVCPSLRLCYNVLSTLELPSYKEFCQKYLSEGQVWGHSE